jgi:hypothetical protein
MDLTTAPVKLRAGNMGNFAKVIYCLIPLFPVADIIRVVVLLNLMLK